MKLRELNIWLWFSVLMIFGSPVTTMASAEDSISNVLDTIKGSSKIDFLNELMKSKLCRDNEQANTYYGLISVELEELDYLEGRLTSLKNYGTLQYCMGRLDSALAVYKIAIDISEGSEFLSIRAAIFNNMGIFFRIKGELGKSIENFQKCYQTGLELQDTILILAALDGQGVVYKKKGQYDSALYNFLLVEKIAAETSHKNILLSAKLNKASIFFDHRREKLDTKDLELALKLAKELGDIISEASIYQILGGKSFMEEAYSEAKVYFENGLKVLGDVNAGDIKTHLLHSIGNVYFKTKQHNKAIEINTTAIKFAEESGISGELALLYNNNASNYLELKNFKKGLEMAKKAIQLSKSSELIDNRVEMYMHLARAYEGLGMYHKAYLAQVDYTQFNNDYRDKKQSDQLQKIEVSYETEKKEAQIKTLSQQTQIQTLELQQKNQSIWIGLVVFVMLLGGGFLVYRQRLAKREKTQIEVEQRFLRSQLNPHFIFNALLAIQNFMLKNSAEAAALYLSKFAKLMREILENSRQEFIPVEDEIKMITNYMDIHKMRLNDVFDYEIEIADTIDPETDTIPPMFVQPFIENAIEHGMARKSGDGLISLKLDKQGDYISIEITDNGGGFRQKIDASNQHTSLATTIIKERMELFNRSLKTKIELLLKEIRNSADEIQGTRVELKVPFSYI